MTERESICQIARSWLGTPYHHMGRIKGTGVDCAMFPLEVYREAGLIGDIEIPFYPQDWMLHRSEEIYLRIVQQHAKELLCHSERSEESLSSPSDIGTVGIPGCARNDKPLPGDFALYRFGRCWSHGAIVLEWPLIIHAVVQHGVILSDGEKDGMLVGRRRRFFSIHPYSAADTMSATQTQNAEVSLA